MRLTVDEVVDIADARVEVTHDATGQVLSARFDLSGLPRVDSLLVGRAVAGVPHLVERLCGICPSAHHVAGIRALEALAGGVELSAAAIAIRRLLHAGAALVAHAPRLAVTDPVGAAAMARLGHLAMQAAGSPGHFPNTAIVGGVTGLVTPDDATRLSAHLDVALTAAIRIANHVIAAPTRTFPFRGADVALVDAAGQPDTLGHWLRAISPEGELIHAAIPSAQWVTAVTEAFPGQPAPQPYLTSLGPTHGHYRVGPMAQLRMGPLTTPEARRCQEQWLSGPGSSRAARAVMAVHAIERIGELITQGALCQGPTVVAAQGAASLTGVGWVDGPRGLLIHEYVTDAHGFLTAVRILTPTAQNEPWLADLLTAAIRAEGIPVESAIREADPCLPCTSAPLGTMDVHLDRVTVGSQQKGL